MFKLIEKKSGISSFKAINEFAKENNIKKIGHTGTLDVLACGLLLIATDDDTKLIQYITNKDKEYHVECKLGYVSKTYDQEGPVVQHSDFVPSQEQVESVIKSFIGKMFQKPPIFSAKKVNGKKSYELARKNQEIELKDIEINIYSISNLKYNYPFIEFDTHVSNGTYIRSLVHDMGIKLNTGAYITFLERTMVNGFRKGQEINLSRLINLDKINVKDSEELMNWFAGKVKHYEIKNGKYLLDFKDNIIGVVEIDNNKVLKNNLFGNKITRLITKD